MRREDVVQDRTRDGRKFRMLIAVDEFNRESLAIEVAHRLDSQSVLAVRAEKTMSIFSARRAMHLTPFKSQKMFSIRCCHVDISSSI